MLLGVGLSTKVLLLWYWKIGVYPCGGNDFGAGEMSENCSKMTDKADSPQTITSKVPTEARFKTLVSPNFRNISMSTPFFKIGF